MSPALPLVGHPRVVFGVAVVIGSVAIVASGAEVFQKVGLALTVMVIYAAWVWYSIKKGLNTEQYADSLYYLGFILTLVSLSAAVLPLLMGEDETPKVHFILAQFGTGLTTTVFGLAGKIFFSQFTVGPDQLLDSAHERAATSLDKFASEIEYSYDYLKSMRSRMADQLESLSTTANRKMTIVAEECTRTVREASQTLVAQMQDTLRAGKQTIADSHNQLTKSISDFHSEVCRLKDTVQAQIALGEEQRQVLKIISATIKEVGKQYSSLSRHADTLSGVQAQLSDVGTSFQTVSQVCNELGKQFETIKLTIEGQTAATTQLAVTLQHELEGIRQLRGELEREVEQTTKVLREVYRALNANSEYIIRKLGS